MIILCLVAGCSTFNEPHTVHIKNIEALWEFDIARFQKDNRECRRTSDHRTLGPWPGIVGITSFPLGVVAAMSGAIQAHYASEATEVDFRECMRKRGYDVKSNRADR